MLICIDYDETYTKDEEFWNDFIVLTFQKGHDIICATMRYDYEGLDVINSIGMYCKIYFTSRLGKRDFLRRLGVLPDIWIDDTPKWIDNDSTIR